MRRASAAPIPAGVNAVIPQEQVDLLADGRIELQVVPKRGQNIRRAGEDIKAGALLLATGTRLEAAEIGLLASQGIPKIETFVPLRVAVVTTGDELAKPGQPIGPGQIYDINSFALRGALERLGCHVTQIGSVADTLSSTHKALAQAAESHDLVITTGGVSVGDEDHVRAAVEALGRLHLWGIAIKPGKPFAFGRIGQTPFLGLPGNPAAALVTFEVLAADFVRQLMGGRNRQVQPLHVLAGFSRARTNPRQEYLRVTPDSVRVYIREGGTKGPQRGGFAIGGYGVGKGMDGNFFKVSTSSDVEIIDPSEPRILWYPA